MNFQKTKMNNFILYFEGAIALIKDIPYIYILIIHVFHFKFQTAIWLNIRIFFLKMMPFINATIDF